MAKSPLQTVIDNWNKRARVLSSQGIDPNSYSKLAQTDINKVRLGGTGITDQEAYDAIASSTNNQSVIGNTKPHNNWWNFPGNAVKDLGNILQAVPMGMFEFAHHLPSETEKTASYFANTLGRSGQNEANWEQQHGYEDTTKFDLSSLAAGLRNVAKTPLNVLAPGEADLANLTTGAGRQEMLTHPVGTLLNAFPEVGNQALGAVSGLAANTATEALFHGDTAAMQAASDAGTLPAKILGSKSVDEMIQGHPLKAAISATPLGGVRDTALSKLNMNPEQRATTRAGAVIEKTGQVQLHDFQDSYVKPIVDALPEEEQSQLWKEAVYPDQYPRDQISPEHNVLLDLNQAATDKLAEMGKPWLSPLHIAGETFQYSNVGAHGDVINMLQQSTHLEDKLQSAKNTLDQAKSDYIDRYGNDPLKGKSKAQIRSENSIQLREDKLNAAKQLHLERVPEGRAMTLQEKAAQYQALRELAVKQRKLDDMKVIHEATYGKPEDMGIEQRRDLRKLSTKSRQYDKMLKTTQDHNTKLLKKFYHTAPTEYMPMIERNFRDTVVGRMSAAEQGKFESLPIPIEQAMKDLEVGRSDRIFSAEDPKSMWSPQNRGKLMKEMNDSWVKMLGEGYHPQYVHSVTEHSFETRGGSVRPLSSKPTPGAVRERTLSLAPHMTHIGIALSDAARQFIQAQGSENYIITTLAPQSLSIDELDREIAPEMAARAGKMRGTSSLANIKDDIMQSNYVKLSDIETGGFTSPKLKQVMSEERYLPVEIANASREFTNPKLSSGPMEAVGKVNRVFKTSIFTFSPSFLAKHIVGGMITLAAAGGWEDWASIKPALEMAHDAIHLFPDGMSRGMDTMDTRDILSYKNGGKFGKFLEQAGKATQFNFKLVSFITDAQRAMAYLGERSRALKSGMTDEVATQMGLEHANKLFVDWLGHTPLERHIIKSVVPFYGITKQFMRFVLTYPIDHPYRASIIANIAEAEQEDWNSGLPKQMMQMFLIGKGDNRKALNWSSVYPYRDIASFFTLSGLVRSLNPLAKGVLTDVGVNTINGTPDLYPQVVFNPDTGTLQAANPPSGVLKFAEQIIPQIGTLDHFFQLTSDMRRLAATNPTSYRKQLFATLGIPFVPFDINLPYAKETSEMARFRAAQAGVAASVKSGSTSGISGLQLVPYQDQMLTPAQLQAQLNQQSQTFTQNALPGTSPKAVTPVHTTKSTVKNNELQQILAALQGINNG